MVTPPFQPGDLIGGRYRLVRLLGAGAMGVVWSARNETTDRDFALKLMLPSSGNNDKGARRMARFLQEAKAAGRLRHRCIVDVYDLGRIEPPDPRAGAPYLVMELLDGEPLDNLLRRIGAIPSGTALSIARDVARALAVAHEKGIVHRDLKPGNLFLHRSIEGATVPKILDFGVSKLNDGSLDAIATTIGTVLGSPSYMSPEQTLGDTDIDGRADVWSLGVILYKCISGALPFRAPTYNSLISVIQEDDSAPLLDVPPAVSSLVARCLAKKKSERFPTAAALAAAIDAVLAAHSLPTLQISQVVSLPLHKSAEHRTVSFRETASTEQQTEIIERARTATTALDPPNATGMHASLEIATPPRRTGRAVRFAFVALSLLGCLGTAIVLTRPPGRAPDPAVEQHGAPLAAPRRAEDVPATIAPRQTYAAALPVTATPAIVSTPRVVVAQPRPASPSVAKHRPPVVASTPSSTTAHAHEGVFRAGF